ncbi:MAG: glucose-6-phosphate dehydrogenase assembly protein OpcA [Termitinemataceae bacterium]
MFPKISSLEKELAENVKSQAAGNARAMSATLITLSSYKDATEIDQWLEHLMGRRPVRLIHVRGNAPHGNRHWTSARCAIDRQARGICFEDIFIESSDDAVYHGRVWGPLVLRELPALLLWNLNLQLLNSCDYDCQERVDLTIIDGSRTSQIQTNALVRQREIILSNLEGDRPLVDLVWEQLIPIRYAFSRLFEGSQSPTAKDIEAIKIAISDPWAAFLLKGWLQDRCKGCPVEVLQTDTKDTLPLASIESIFVDGTRGQADVVSPRRAVIKKPDGKALQISLPDNSIGAILERLVDTPRPDPLYHRALKAAQ